MAKEIKNGFFHQKNFKKIWRDILKREEKGFIFLRKEVLYIRKLSIYSLVMKGKLMDINEKISLSVWEIMKLEIEEAGGNEVFLEVFQMKWNSHRSRSTCKGNKYSVPAIIKAMKRRGFNS